MDIKKLNITILGSSGTIGSSLAKKYLNDGNNLNLFYSFKKFFRNLWITLVTMII